MGELGLYKNDRTAWLARVAPRQAERFSDATYDDTVASAVWGAMGDDYKAAVWNLLPDAQKDRIRRIRSAA